MDMPLAREITLRQLRALAALAEAGSFRRAASRLGVTQPSLSAQVRALEAAVGCTLVERGRRGAVLTPDGRAAERHARAVLDAVRALADGVSGGAAGTLRLGVAAAIGPYLLPAAVARLRAGGAGLRLHVREAEPRTLADRLAAGEHEAIVTRMPLAGVDLEAEALFRERLFLVLARDHPLALRPRLAREDLRGLAVLSLDPPAGAPRGGRRDEVAALCAECGAVLQQGYEGSSLDALRLMAGLGMGAAFLPALYVRSEIRPGGDVVAREIEDRPIHRHIGLAWRRSTGRSPEVAALGRLLADTFRALSAGGPEAAAQPPSGSSM